MKSKLLTLLFFVPFLTFAQYGDELPIDDQFDLLATEWLQKSEILHTYAGVNEYCQNPSFRAETDKILKAIHHYDSLIIDKLTDPSSYFAYNAKEEKKTLKDITELESAFSFDNFLAQMRSSCEFRNEIEKNAKTLKNGNGFESYDGKILVLETEIAKYLNKIDKLVLRVDNHIHILEVE